MKATQMKSMITKGMAAALLAGMLFFAGSRNADAQQFSVGVQFGTPVYGNVYAGNMYAAYPDYYARRGYYDHLRWEQARRAEMERQEWMRRQAYARHEQHERWDHGRGYDRDGYRGR